MATPDDLFRALPDEKTDWRHSSLYVWLMTNRAEFSKRLAEEHPGWPTLAKRFAILGITGRGNRPASPEMARHTWWRVRCDMGMLDPAPAPKKRRRRSTNPPAPKPAVVRAEPPAQPLSQPEPTSGEDKVREALNRLRQEDSWLPRRG